MVEIVSTSIQRRVTTRRVTRSTAGQTPPAAEVVEYVVAKVGVPGREGPPGPPGQAGPPGEGTETDPGDLTLLFDNKLI
ncbi:hypothetical protein ASG32_08105 [Methylobacterium sp. Leaf361]|uniref:hypothetical protein n=1 Tax=Methylobacterium sp. Leaf361 TaxID=1736352 RepID=UPI0006F807A8|nr:hypothetical protein [Methylobacterium sp. Leaf361]KQS75050.1 hypothetical protein ASG32_08105 [Methylobacterium sp. Leaf361]